MGGRLTSQTVRRERIDPALRERMLALMTRCYDGVDRSRFHQDLDAKQVVILLYDRASRELAGFSTLRVTDHSIEGREVRVLFSGDTVIDPAYWGQRVLDAAFTKVLIHEKLRRPFTPLYWLLLSAGFKTYLMVIRYFPRSFPRRTEPAPGLRPTLESLCEKLWPTEFDPARGIVRFSGHYRVKTGIAPIDRQKLTDPDIAFFAARNPGHVDGDELACIARVRWIDLASAFVRIARKRLARVPSGRRVGPRNPAVSKTG